MPALRSFLAQFAYQGITKDLDSTTAKRMLVVNGMGVASACLCVPSALFFWHWGHLGLFSLVLACMLIITHSWVFRHMSRRREQELKALAKKVQENEERFRQILDAIPELILVKGPQSRIVWANQAFLEHYGLTREDLMDLIDAPPPQTSSNSQYIKDDQWVFENKTKLDIHDEMIQRHDGQMRSFHTIKAPIFNSEYDVIMTVGVSRDITERKEREQVIQEQQAELVEHLAKMSALGEMAGGIGHEINNPLAAIRLCTDQLTESLNAKPLDLEEARFLVEDIDVAAERIASIVRGLRSFSRSGVADPFLPIHVRGFFDETLAFCREKLLRKGVTLRLEEPADNLIIEARQTELSQVLVNLLNNAVDAVESLKERWVSISVRSSDSFIEITVTDSGGGIPHEHRDKLFNRAFTTKAIGQGTGLGLGICRRIIESHGGQIGLDTSCANTRFFVRLPYSQPARDAGVGAKNKAS